MAGCCGCLRAQASLFFLWTGEFTTPSSKDFDKETHLSLSDLTLDSRTSPQLIQIHIKQSKTDPFIRGAAIFLSRTGGAICSVKVMTAYLAFRSPQPGPLFVFESGTPLSRTELLKLIHQTLQDAGIDPTLYNGHSFRIGEATTAANAE